MFYTNIQFYIKKLSCLHIFIFFSYLANLKSEIVTPFQNENIIYHLGYLGNDSCNSCWSVFYKEGTQTKKPRKCERQLLAFFSEIRLFGLFHFHKSNFLQIYTGPRTPPLHSQNIPPLNLNF